MQGKAARDVYRQMAAVQKDSLLDLYYDRNRVPLSNSAALQQRQRQLSNQILHLVSRDFIDIWRRFIRDPNRRDPESLIVNGSLLCPHGGLLYDPATPEESASSSRFVVVTQAEWNTLFKFYSADQDITVERDLQSNTLITKPAVCEECVLARLKVEERELLHYEKARIFIRKVAVTKGKNDHMQDTGSGSNVASSECKDDPEYQGSDAKRPKLALPSCSSPTSGVSASAGDARVRKSTRHRRMRGEKELYVSSKQTLKELKVMVMNLFHVAPFDQNLSIGGRDLLDNEATLESLHVYPHSVILLKADEPGDDASLMDDDIKPDTFEEGFKGTQLLK